MEMEIKIVEVEALKLNLQPDETLIIKIVHDDVTADSLNYLGNYMRKMFPNNKVIVLGVGEGGSIDLTIVKYSSIITEEVKNETDTID